MRTPSVFFMATIALLAPLAPLPARAAGGDDAAAEALFTEGRRLADAQRFDEACPKFAASAKLAPAPGTLLNLADCYEHLGKTASAWATFRQASAEAQRTGRADRDRVARDRAAALEPRLAHVTIVVTRGVDGLVVKRDDTAVDSAALSAAIPVDPGSHHIEASAPHHAPWSTTVDVADSVNVVVKVPELDVVAGDQAASPTGPAPSPDADEHPGRTQRVLGAGAIGVGVVLVGVGAVFGLSAKSKVDDAKSSPHCRGDTCDAVGAQMIDDAKSKATISTVAFIAAGAFAATGAVLWLTAPSGSPRAGVGVGAGATAGGGPSVSLRGTF